MEELYAHVDEQHVEYLACGRIWLERLGATLLRSKRERDLETEIEYHLDSLAAGYVKKGLNEREARLAAKRDFGALEPMKETIASGAASR